MANELLISANTGQTLYALLFNHAGQVWNGSAFETPQGANWANYDLPMTEAGTTGIYRASMPAVVAGVYTFALREQAGASPAVGDSTVGSGSIQWDGSAEVVLADLPIAILGGGTIAWTYTLLSDVDSAPIPQARVEVWNEDDTLFITQAYTDNNGEVVFCLDPGTYNIRRSKAGWSFTNPDIETIEEPAP